MTTEKRLTVLQQFIKDKPMPEDYIYKYLTGERKEGALGLVAWLRNRGLNPLINRSSPNSWEAGHKGGRICTLQIAYSSASRDEWHVSLKLTNLDAYGASILGEGLQDILWDGTSYCRYGERSPFHGMAKAPGCSPKKPCKYGKDMTVLGKAFTQCCVYADGRTVGYANPDEATLKALKRLLESERSARDGTPT